MRSPRSTGFTLIELIVAMAIIAIVSAVALPAFQDSVRKSRRADAHSALLRVATNQEKWRANNSSYTEDLTKLGFSAASNANSTDGFYTINITAGSGTAMGFEAKATPKSGTPQANDTCTADNLIITQNGPKISSAQQRTCWGK